MKKISFGEMCKAFDEHNKKNNVTSQFEDKNSLTGVIVYTKDSFDKEYPEVSRSYRVSSDNKYFLGMCGTSLFGHCLDGSESYVRLDWYFGQWKIDYCYLEEKTEA